MTTEHDQGDYVLVHKSKAKISRARKMIIGVMAIGAVAAMTNAGTFASFSAATTNTAQFKTGRLVLSNTQNSDTTCFSSAVTDTGTIDSGTNLDSNANTCGAVFTAILKPGETSTTNLTLKNEADYAATLSYFDTAASCSTTVAGPGVIAGTDTNGGLSSNATFCNTLTIQIQQYDSLFATPVAKCVYPAAASACAASYGSISGLPKTFAANTAIDTAVPAGQSRYFQITVKFPDGGVTATGQGRDNPFMNRKTNTVLRWQLTAN